MQATSSRHFWLTSFHVHTWDFLEGAAAPVNLSVFRKRVQIKPLTFLEMSKWLLKRIELAGLTLRFNRLVPEGASVKMLSRAEMAYWRLLVDETGGNQSVAEQYFVNAMSQGENENEIEIRLFESPSESSVLKLNDLDLFVMMSVLIHDGLDLGLLQKTLNADEEEIQTACRHLVALGICFLEKDILQVEISWRPQVVRALKKRRLLHLE